MKWWGWCLAGVAFLWLGVGKPAPAAAASAPVEVLPEVHYTFGEQILFQARFTPPDKVTKAVIFYRPAWQQAKTFFGEMTLEPDGTAFFAHNLQEAPFPAFITLYYWFRLTLADGTTYTSPSFTFVLTDTRFHWQTMEAPPFHVFWYRGDAGFARQIADAAAAGLSQAQALWNAPTPESVAIYAYADPQALQSALGLESWAAGHASPRLGALYVALPPGPQQEAEIRRLVPHELAHYLLYHLAGDVGYHNLPVWLNEGLASVTELTPNPDYAAALEHAAQTGDWLPLSDLCAYFPNDASGALLAYAESASFMQYLLKRYGRATVHTLVLTYAQGVGCQEGVVQVLGEPLPLLMRDWQRSIAPHSPLSDALTRLLPWLLLLGVVGASLLAGAWMGRKNRA